MFVEKKTHFMWVFFLIEINGCDIWLPSLASHPTTLNLKLK